MSLLRWIRRCWLEQNRVPYVVRKYLCTWMFAGPLFVVFGAIGRFWNPTLMPYEEWWQTLGGAVVTFGALMTIGSWGTMAHWGWARWALVAAPVLPVILFRRGFEKYMPDVLIGTTGFAVVFFLLAFCIPAVRGYFAARLEPLTPEEMERLIGNPRRD
jgi:hypothetical protein